MRNRVGVLDYGAGNITNVVRAFAKIGVEAEVSDAPEQVNRYSHLILPGVGSFGQGIFTLEQTGIGQALAKRVADGVPLLGICLGMQMLADTGYENGEERGLGLIRGKVVSLGGLGSGLERPRVPNTGWAPLTWLADPNQAGLVPLGAGYFNHSFIVSNHTDSQLLAVSEFGNFKIPAVIAKESIVATQFHPEKSGPNGLVFLRSWLDSR